MKTIISGFGAIVLFILCILINSSIINFTSRNTELNTAINNAVIDTQRVLYDNSYSINSADEYLAEFTQNLLQYINSNSDIEIKVYAIDEKSGFLDVGVVSKYKNLLGESREFEERRTSIIDVVTRGDINLPDTYFISFQVKNNIKVDLSNLDFFIPKESTSKTLKMPLLSGNVDNIYFSGEGTGNYSIEELEGQKYIVIQLENLNSDMTITIQ